MKEQRKNEKGNELSIYKIVFKANKLHEIGRPILLHVEEIEASNRITAVSQLYHTYEHIKILGIERRYKAKGSEEI